MTQEFDELEKILLTRQLSQDEIECLIAKYIYITPATSMINNYIRENDIHINMEHVIENIYNLECQKQYTRSRFYGCCTSFSDFESDYIRPKYLDKYMNIFSCISGDYLYGIGL